MGDNNWWFNNLGQFAPASNPGSAVPNYALTFDVATAPWDSQADFNALSNSQVVSKVAPPRSVQRPKPQAGEDPTLWDHAKDFGSWLGHEAGGLVGAFDTAVDKVGFDATGGHKFDDLEKEADRRGLTGWARMKFIGSHDFSHTVGKKMKDLNADPVVGKVFWGLDKVSEGVSTFEVSATEAQKLYGQDGVGGFTGFFHGNTWARAHDLVKKRDLNAGEAFMQMFYDDEVLDDEKRFEKIRQHSTVFNVGALTFNTIGAWKADPNIFVGKGFGAVRNAARGKLAEGGTAAAIQRDVLAQTNRTAAKQVARSQTGLAGRVHGQYAMSLWDKAQQMREAARTLGAEDFQKLAPFKNSASGPTMARLMQDVADDDEAWNLVFRTAIGDPEAITTLASQRGEVADKLTAIEMKQLPHLESEFQRVKTRYEKKAAEQGKTFEDDLTPLSYSHWLNDQDLQDALVDLYATKDQLAAYRHYDSWLQRATAGFGEENKANSVFGNLDYLNPKGTLGERFSNSLYDLGGKVRTFRHDEYSPVARAIRAPLKPMLKRVGVVNLNDVEEGGHAVGAYLDQIAYVTGKKDQALRDHVIGRWAGSVSDVERKDIVDSLEEQAIVALGRKHGIDPEAMGTIARDIQKRRGQTWGRMSNRSLYTTVRDGKGRRLDLMEFKDEDGVLHHVQMPMDPTELPDWRPLTNLTDLDHTLRNNRDLFKEYSRFEGLRKKGLASKRQVENTYQVLGETLNAYWKPAALISLRWPARVVADESFRVMLMLGVMPHMKAWGAGAMNTLHNKGVVRPYEWWNGRKVRTGAVREESLRTQYDEFDPFDHRRDSNPTGAVPVDAADFGKIDQTRYDKLNGEVAKREQYLRKLEVHRSQTREARKQSARMGEAVSALTKPERPKWAQQWDDRLNEAEKSETRGFFFDPVTRKASNKGFAVSVYPGRLRTFDRKPSARELNFWTKKNSDLLAIPSNKVGVWRDRETGRWHLDVVRTHRRREDAMSLAARAQANEFYDIEQGFTRFMADEDPFDHYTSPLVNPESSETVQLIPGVGGVNAPVRREADAIGEALGSAVDIPRPRKRGMLYGKTRWRSSDGKIVEGERFGGLDPENQNLWVSNIGSKSAFHTMFGGYTKGLGRLRGQRRSMGYKVFSADDPADIAGREAWAEAWTYYVNNHLRKSPIWRKMLDGQSDREIVNWLYTAEGRKLRTRMGPRGSNPNRWVQDMRAIYDHTLPTPQARLAARQGDVEASKVDELIPFEQRNDVHGHDIQMAEGTHEAQGLWKAFTERAYNMLGAMPTDHLVRHPFARNLYDMRMKNYLSSVPKDQITPEVLAAAEASARAFTVKQVRKLLYNLADESNATHMLRFVAPFFQAQVEVLQRYAHIWTEKPETIARTLQLYMGSHQVHTGLYQVVDKDGNPTTKNDHDNQVVVQVTPFMRKIAHQIPGLRKALDNAGSVQIPEASIDLIFQGEGAKAFLPSLGPLVNVPASEFYFKRKPFKAQGEVFKWMFPFGTPDNVGDAMLPAWGRRMWTYITNNFDDSAYANRANIIYQDMMFRWERNGKDGPQPTEKDALEAARSEMLLRAASSFASPVPVTARSPQQFYIDQARKFQDKFGAQAMDKFYETYGPDYFRYYTEATKSTDGLAPTTSGAKGYFKNKRLIDEAPDLAGVLAGPFQGQGEFNYEVYKWQLRTKRAPLSSDNIRELQSPEERIQAGEVDQGWIEYGKLSSAIDAELRRRGLTSIMNNGAEDLRAIKDSKVEEIISRNPAWQEAYRSRQDHLSSWLNQAYKVAFDKQLDGRTDIQGLRTYLISRANIQDVLQRRQALGISQSDSLSATENQDIAAGWDSYLRELVSKNPLFGEIYHRYLEDDDLTVMVS